MRRPGSPTAFLLIVMGVVAVAAGIGVGSTVLADQPVDRIAPGGPPALATTPASTALPVNRRSDPPIDRYTWTESARTPLRRMTGAQRWMARRASPFVAHDSDPRVSLNLTGWGTDPDVHVYVNATGVSVSNPAALRGARRWLVAKDDDPVLVDGWRMLDLRDPAARRWWLYGSDRKASCNPDRGLRATLDLIACGYTGLWIDNVLTDPGFFKPDPGIDRAAWGDGVVALLTELRAALPSGVPFTVNTHWTATDFPWKPEPTLDLADAAVRAAVLADQLVIEGGAIDAGLDYAGAETAPWSYPRLLQYVEAMHGAGVRVQWEKVGSEGLTQNAIRELGALPSCSDARYDRRWPAWKRGSAAWRAHVRTAGFNLASALLTYAPGDSVGDICEYPGRGFDGYGIDLGAPTAARSRVGDLDVRPFTGGHVAVNASMRPAVLTLPDGRTGVDVATRSRAPGPAAATFTLPPRTAAIVRYD